MIEFLKNYIKKFDCVHEELHKKIWVEELHKSICDWVPEKLYKKLRMSSWRTTKKKLLLSSWITKHLYHTLVHTSVASQKDDLS